MNRQSNPFFYVVRHEPSGIRYAGVRVARGCDPSDLGTRYFTSSRIVRGKWKGGERFEVERIRVFSTGAEAAKWEGRFLARIKAADSPMWFNRCHGGTSPMLSYWQSETGKEERVRIMKEYWGNPENKQAQAERRKEYYANNPDAIEAHRRKMKLYYTNPENRRKVSEAAKRQFSTREARRLASQLKGGREFKCVETGKVFVCQSEAAHEYGLARESVRDALNGRKGVQHAGGYTFRYLDGDDRDVLTYEQMLRKKAIAISRSKGGFPVLCVETGQTFTTQGQAAKHLGVFQSHISKFFRGEIKHVKGYTFRRVND